MTRRLVAASDGKPMKMAVNEIIKIFAPKKKKLK
jgi:hypothetical protein